MEFKVVQKELELKSRGWIPTFHDVSNEVMEIVAESGVKNGTVCVASHHTTCSVMVQEASHDIDSFDLEYLQHDLLDIMQTSTGRLPYVFALSQQDITPYGNDLYHLNSILQPATATNAPVVGVAITTETIVAGCATGATHFVDCEEAARFMLEVAKYFGKGDCKFYDEEEYALIQKLYGPMGHFQTKGRN